MLPDGLKELLVLQDRDTRRVQAEKNLAAVPRERAGVERKIEGHRQTISEAKEAVNAVELRRKEIEQALAGYEDQLRKYKSQQLMVKKNDEYQALTHEIELSEKQIDETESAEIEILIELDEVKAATAETEKRETEAIAAEEDQLRRIDEREANLNSALTEARAEVATARRDVNASLLKRYDGLANTIGLPAVVALTAQKCRGCHLKVSSGVDAEVRVGTEIVACDNCTRILFQG